jgi:hypothetical protein
MSKMGSTVCTLSWAQVFPNSNAQFDHVSLQNRIWGLLKSLVQVDNIITISNPFLPFLFTRGRHIQKQTHNLKPTLYIIIIDFEAFTCIDVVHNVTFRHCVGFGCVTHTQHNIYNFFSLVYECGSIILYKSLATQNLCMSLLLLYIM